MIVLTVLSYNGDKADGLSAQLDELGGTIGRADNNQLVLPDPERTISRVHARVVFRAGRYAIVDNGSNPISVNGLAVGAGREHPLNPGDKVEIGGYLIEAREGAAGTASDDPFADLFSDGPVGLAAPVSAPAPARAPASAPSMQTTAWPSPAAPAPRPFAPAPPHTRSPAPAAAGAPGQIPDDWDPFAPDTSHAPMPGGTAAPAPALGASLGELSLDLPMGGTDSLDDLFGLSGVAPAADPLTSAARTATLMPPSRSDHVSELNTPMSLPRSPRTAPQAPQPSELPSGAILSWNDPPRDGRVVTLPGVMLPSPPASSPLAPAPNRPPAMAQAPARSGGGNDAALLAALLEGLDAPGLKLHELTPDTMRTIGVLLRESVRGAVELLVARAALKREMRAEMTMIVSRQNNPLKFSPTVEVALAHLLGPSSPGFMPAAPAVRDAFDDLRAHQLGVMAGMRAALEGVLQRFNPEQLESKLTRKSTLASLIPAARKARLWELFNELFAQLQTEAQDDFDELFGKAFLRAYEDQLDRLHGEAGPR